MNDGFESQFDIWLNRSQRAPCHIIGKMRQIKACRLCRPGEVFVRRERHQRIISDFARSFTVGTCVNDLVSDKLLRNLRCLNAVVVMPNRLQNELSPYLLQHAENPVDWYPWSDEALTRAKEEDKPIFLSIGYSACHWCHVMEHESFESEQIAEILNTNFVNIKVDREERPDLDQLYMNAVMALRGGGGGWPLSVFLTPSCEVFFGGTYWPPEARMGMPGFGHVLMRVLHAYRENRDQVDGQSSQITQWLANNSQQNETVVSSQVTLDHAAKSLQNSFDFQNGGFGSAPKFPHPMDLRLLLRLWQNWSDEKSPNQDELMQMVRLNLKKMAYGGIFDHLAGGFARYSVDEHWLVPHFEKMLYDNGLLATTYFETYRATGDPFFAMIGRKTLDYLQQYMTSPQGGIYSTEDADSEGEEGKFYVWNPAEVNQLLGDDVGSRFCQLYHVTASGNFEGASILNMTKSYGDWADEFGVTKDELRDEMRNARKVLLAARDKRIRPGLDDKILCCWNSLAIVAFCEGAISTGNPSYLESAQNGFEFIWNHLRDENGNLLRLWRNGTAKQTAFLDDYSYLLDALYSLYSVTFNERYVTLAQVILEQMLEQFSDEQPGLFFTPKSGEALIARTKDYQDSSVPSGNSMAATTLLKWGQLCGNNDWLELAEKTLQFGAEVMERSPLASGQFLMALQTHLATSQELVLLLPAGEVATEYMQQIHEKWRPNLSVICRCEASEYESSRAIDKVLNGKSIIDNQPTLFVCQGYSCQSPVTGKQNILDAIKQL